MTVPITATWKKISEDPLVWGIRCFSANLGAREKWTPGRRIVVKTRAGCISTERIGDVIDWKEWNGRVAMVAAVMTADEAAVFKASGQPDPEPPTLHSSPCETAQEAPVMTRRQWAQKNERENGERLSFGGRRVL